MHQATHISYGEGKVNIVLDTSSQMEVAAPDFRFGDYSEVVTSCFTQKELDRISQGESADLTFSFVMSDDIDDAALKNHLYDAVSESEKTLGMLHEGVFISVSANKSFDDGQMVPVVNLQDEVDIQMDIPLYLVKEDRDYFFLTHNMGEDILFTDASPDADVLTIETDVIGDGVLLYQDSYESKIDKSQKGFNISIQHVFVLGAVVLIALWFAVDYMHRNNK